MISNPHGGNQSVQAVVMDDAGEITISSNCSPIVFQWSIKGESDRNGQ
jgi:hypothetical protein